MTPSSDARGNAFTIFHTAIHCGRAARMWEDPRSNTHPCNIQQHTHNNNITHTRVVCTSHYNAQQRCTALSHGSVLKIANQVTTFRVHRIHKRLVNLPTFRGRPTAVVLQFCEDGLGRACTLPVDKHVRGDPEHPQTEHNPRPGRGGGVLRRCTASSVSVREHGGGRPGERAGWQHRGLPGRVSGGWVAGTRRGSGKRAKGRRAGRRQW